MSEFEFSSVKNKSEGLFKDRGSKFIAYLFPMGSVEDFKEGLNEVKQLHPTARHFCYAYRIGLKGEEYRANDDGEPSGSAGMPILNQLLSANITNVGAVVVRYFGGTKLGVSGLINAYKVSVAEAIAENEIVTRELLIRAKLVFEYPVMSDVMNLLKRLDVNIIDQQFELSAEVIIEIDQSFEDQFNQELSAIDGVKYEKVKVY